MPKTNKERQSALKQRKAEMGLKRREFWLADCETLQVKAYLAAIRGKTKIRIMT